MSQSTRCLVSVVLLQCFVGEAFFAHLGLFSYYILYFVSFPIKVFLSLDPDGTPSWLALSFVVFYLIV